MKKFAKKFGEGQMFIVPLQAIRRCVADEWMHRGRAGGERGGERGENGERPERTLGER